MSDTVVVHEPGGTKIISVGIQGPRGVGEAATVQVGNVVTGAPGAPVVVTSTGDENHAVLDFVIPEGEKGDPGSALVQSVNGKQGDVVLDATNVQADAAGSASQALLDAKAFTTTEVSALDAQVATELENVATAMGGKVDKVTGKQLSTNDYSDPEKTKLAGIEAEATKNRTDTDTDTLLSGKADKSSTYTKTEVDTKDAAVAANAQASIDASAQAQQAALNALTTAVGTDVSTLQAAITGLQSGKVDKTSLASKVYVTDSAGNQTTIGYSPIYNAGGQLVQRTADNQIDVPLPVGVANATSKGYVDARIIQGVGMPNGVISAPVGTLYEDTNATNGATLWVKANGTGNTGWRVAEGDTGWRNIASLVDSADISATTQAIIRRVGGVVEVKFDLNFVSPGGLNKEVAPISTISTSLLGFRPILNVWQRVPMVDAGGTTLIGYFKPSDSLRIKTSQAAQIRFADTFTTVEQWPFNLPGTAL